MINLIIAFATWLLGLFGQIASWFGDLMVSLASELAEWLVPMLPPGLQAFMGGLADDIQGLLYLVAQVSYFLPIIETIGFFMLILGFQASIRLTKWTLKLIPNFIVGG